MRQCRISDCLGGGGSVSNPVVNDVLGLYIHFMHGISHKWTCEQHFREEKKENGSSYYFCILVFFHSKIV